MYEITEKKQLTDNIYLMNVKAPRVSSNCQPGQFIIVAPDKRGERIPLTICDFDRKAETVTIVFQAVGHSTKRMAEYEVGDRFEDVVGPLGKRAIITDYSKQELLKKRILFVAGGVGAAPVYPQIKWIKDNGFNADCIIGARNREAIILEDKRKYSKNLYICTDGSYCFKGNTVEYINELVTNQGKQYDIVIAIGSMIMMKYVCALTKELDIKTIVSLNPIMVDGIGMCGACRVTVGNEIKFACVDGPEFDGHLVDFDEAMNRLNTYRSDEKKVNLRLNDENTHHHTDCKCH